LPEKLCKSQIIYIRASFVAPQWVSQIPPFSHNRSEVRQMTDQTLPEELDRAWDKFLRQEERTARDMGEGDTEAGLSIAPRLPPTQYPALALSHLDGDRAASH
jgi:hypothetical protein